jgi:hypothetical protein
MTKRDIEFGHATIEEFFWLINERHRIYLAKEAGKPKPWTGDSILQSYAFTNAFRQLDRGTKVLREQILEGHYDEPLELLVFNICWYRLFNWRENASLGFCDNFEDVAEHITNRWKAGKQVFTGAYMTRGYEGVDKYQTYIEACKHVWDNKHYIAEACREYKSMEKMWEYMKDIYTVGPFVSYELVCDFRFTKLLEDATDVLTWANLGPGAWRGLQRLGLVKEKKKYNFAFQRLYYLALHGDKSWDNPMLTEEVRNCEWPFEMREIEHCLCEFDKYMRVKTGAGRPRSKYNGKD